MVAGHAPVDEAGIDLLEVVGSESEPFHHAGTETLEKNVSFTDEPQDLLPIGRILEVGLDDAATAQQSVGVTSLGGK